MKKNAATYIYMIFLCIAALAWNESAAQSVNRLREIVVTTRRPLKDIGVQKTDIDSAMLKENIALSMADILTFNSSVFVKNYGRATLSTVAFRGTSPSHTQVTWNGLRLNSPMLGMTDFSTIPAYFIDSATLLHGTSSINETGGGLGGLVRLSSMPDINDGWNMQYIQGIGSFSTFDEFLKVTYGSEKLQTSTRIAYSSSPNDYKYTNHDKKVNIYDDNHNIIGQYHPTERNKSGAFNDFNILQDIFVNIDSQNRLGLNVWFTDSRRELPLLTVDYGSDTEFINRQHEHTLRSVVSWNHSAAKWHTALKGGWLNTEMKYIYKRQVAAGGMMKSMTDSHSRVNTLYGQADGGYTPAQGWYITASAALYQHFVRSEDRSIVTASGDNAIVGYDKGRVEFSGSASVKWQPYDRLGMSVVLRESMFGNKWASLVPAFFIDGTISRRGNIMARASVSRNHKFPTLNDMYFMPGGNPDLKSEHGLSYDAGISCDIGKSGIYGLDASVSWFDSYISDWILWLPTTKGFFSPRNVGKVHAYGVETHANLELQPMKGWFLYLNGSASWTPSVNQGPALSPADRSVGKQLPYIPKWSASLTGRLAWRSWMFTYKWCYYSRRYTMSSNDVSITGNLPAYFMSNISLEKSLAFHPVDLQLKLAINNLFNEDYLSVLSRPMPGINFEFFISVTPKFLNKKRKQ